MNNMTSHFSIGTTEDQLNEKLINLQKELIEARLQQENLRRINKNLQDTIKNATINQHQEFNPAQRLSMNMTWKQKYEQEVTKNLQSQKYIRVLEKKKSTRKTLSLANHTNSKQKNLQKNRIFSNYSTAIKQKSNNNYEPSTEKLDRKFNNFAQNTQMSLKLCRKSSVSKMDNFIDKLFCKDDNHRNSQITLNTRKFDRNRLTNQNNNNVSSKKILSMKKYQDRFDQNFYSVEGMYKQRQQQTENDENVWDYIEKKMALKCNTNKFINKKYTLNTQYQRQHKTKLQLSAQFR